MSAEKLVDLEIAKGLKEIGFDLEVDNLYNLNHTPPKSESPEKLDTYVLLRNWNEYSDTISRPTLSHAAQYMREVHSLDVNPYLYDRDRSVSLVWRCCIIDFDFSCKRNYPIIQHGITESGENGDKPLEFDNHEDAMSLGILKAIKLVKERTNISIEV